MSAGRLQPRRCPFLVFFFQAEDGIRDRTVTGVQTCALPILTISANAPAIANIVGSTWERNVAARSSAARARCLPVSRPRATKIGRASCRERVEPAAAGGAVEKKPERRGSDTE